MTELEKLKAGLEYCYDDPEVDALKEQAIIWCQQFNALDPLILSGSALFSGNTSAAWANMFGSRKPSTAITERTSISETISLAITISRCWISGKSSSETM